MRTTRIVRDAVLLFLGVLLIVTVFAVAGRVRAAYGAEEAVVSRATYRMAVQGQVARHRRDARTIRRLRRELHRKSTLVRRLGVGYRRDLAYGIRLAHALYGVPESEMWVVTRCENPRGDKHARNRSSGAYSWWQYLSSTWSNQGLPGFTADDPVASTLNTARIVAREGWSQWACKPR